MKIIDPSFEILTPIDGEEILKSIETVGRTCYKSEDKITDGSARRFVANLIERGHEAMIEHVSVSVRFVTDRGVSHEIVRHRMASYAQESTRYCNYSKDKFGNSVTYSNIGGGLSFDSKIRLMDSNTVGKIMQEWLIACEDAEKHYFNLLELGATPQIARSVLNNSTKTEIVVTMNLRVEAFLQAEDGQGRASADAGDSYPCSPGVSRSHPRCL